MSHLPLPSSAPPSNIKRFRTNPVELVIFSVVSLIFFNSVYNLFYDQQGFRPAALQPMSANPISEGRSPASVAPAFGSIELKCGAGGPGAGTPKETTASKIRITGALCGPEGSDLDTSKVVKIEVINTANKFAATVFTDVNAGKFSTDYIPLNLSKNPIRVEFSYPGGKTVAQDLTVVRN